MKENKHHVIINKDKCIGCGQCVKDCVANTIKIEDGKAMLLVGGCIKCGHCEAICKQNAITIDGFEENNEEFEEQTRLDSDTLLKAIKTRRTIRNFLNNKVNDELIDKIIEAGRLAPTGANRQDTGFIVLGSKQEEAENEAVKMFQKLTKVGKVFIKFLRTMDINDHFFFKKAPLVIVLTGNPVNASLSAENMAFMAEALGLGVLFSGFFTTCVNNNKKRTKSIKLIDKNF